MELELMSVAEAFAAAEGDRWTQTQILADARGQFGERPTAAAVGIERMNVNRAPKVIAVRDRHGGHGCRCGGGLSWADADGMVRYAQRITDECGTVLTARSESDYVSVRRYMERIVEKGRRIGTRFVSSEKLNTRTVTYSRTASSVTYEPKEAVARRMYEELQRSFGKTVGQIDCFSQAGGRKRSDTFVVEDGDLIEWKSEPTWDNARRAVGQWESYNFFMNKDPELSRESRNRVIGFSSEPDVEVTEFLLSLGFSIIFMVEDKFERVAV